MKTTASVIRRATLALGVLGVLASAPVKAQDVSESHLAAARGLIDVLNATDPYDSILPAAAQALKAELINKDPNLQDIIVATVDETALALASRRKDLEDEAARAYANAFSEEELNAITEFYKSPAGEKFQKEAPIVVRSVTQAAQVWQNGIARDLAQETGKKLAGIVSEQAPAAPADGTAPAEGEKPAEEAPKQ